MKNLLTNLLILISISLHAQVSITSGPDVVCPDQSYTYTAQASSEGCFAWSFYEDGQWQGNTTLPCCNTGYSSTSSYTHTFSSSLDQKDVTIRVTFVPRFRISCSASAKDYDLAVTKRVFPAGQASIGDGTFVFCSGNETRTVTIPGVPVDGGAGLKENCDWHHKWIYEAPPGWKIDGGSNTKTTGNETIQLTSSSSVHSGYSGDYDLDIIAEEAFPWSEYTRTVSTAWIGSPASMSGYISGPTSPSVGSIVTYSINSSLPDGAASFYWQLPYGTNPCYNDCWQILNNWGNSIRVEVGSDPGYVQVWGQNVCGSGGAKILYVSPTGGGGGGIPQQQMVSPNPSGDGMFTISHIDNNDKLITEELDQKVTYIVHNSTGEIIYKNCDTKPRVKIDLRQFNKGLYYLTIFKEKIKLSSHTLKITK